MKRDDTIDILLIESIKQGDQKAFELLFNLFYSSLINYARVYVKQLNIAEEIVQETFIRVWESRLGLESDRSPKAYLYRSVHNNCINYFRKRQLQIRLTEENESEIRQRIEMLESDLNDSIFEKLATQELEISIQRAINSLPDQCKEVFILSRYHDLSYQQISDKLSISINTVKTHMSRALEKIRKNLKIF